MGRESSVFKIITASVFLTACGGSSNPADENTSTLILDATAFESLGTASQLSYENIVADVFLNGGYPQRFYLTEIRDGASVSGVRTDAANTMKITWFEEIDGLLLPISEQEQRFIADDNGGIFVPHDYSIFDYDSDGLSNFDERTTGSCVWSVSETCEVTSFNQFINGDFTLGSNGWSSAIGEIGVNGDFCITRTTDTSASPVPLRYLRTFNLVENEFYRLSFDVVGSSSDTIVFSIGRRNNDNGGFYWVDLDGPWQVPVSTTVQRHEHTFMAITTTDRTSQSLTFEEPIGDNRVCVDNFSLVRI